MTSLSLLQNIFNLRSGVDNFADIIKIAVIIPLKDTLK